MPEPTNPIEPIRLGVAGCSIHRQQRRSQRQLFVFGCLHFAPIKRTQYIRPQRRRKLACIFGLPLLFLAESP